MDRNHRATGFTYRMKQDQRQESGLERLKMFRPDSFSTRNGSHVLTGLHHSSRLNYINRVCLTVLLTVLSLGVVGPKAQGQNAGQDGLILFVLENDSSKQIYVANADGSNAKALTEPEENAGSPAWGPDRTHIAYSAQDGDVFNVFVMNSDGTDKRAITQEFGYFNSSPTWSPDGRFIAFTSDQGGEEGIFLLPIEGGEPRSLTASEAGSGVISKTPAWSPDGKKIAFASTREEGSFQLYLMNTDGSEVEALTSPDDETEKETLAWSPDGQSIAYAAVGETGTDIFVYDRVTKQSSLITSLTSTDDETLVLNALSWSDDNTSLMYIQSRLTSDETITSVFVIAVNGQGVRPVSIQEQGTLTALVWSAPSKTASLSTSLFAPIVECTISSNSETRVNEGPGMEYEAFDYIPPKTIMKVKGVTYSSDGWAWYWLEEGGWWLLRLNKTTLYNEECFSVPVYDLDEEYVASVEECPGAADFRLGIGDQAEVNRQGRGLQVQKRPGDFPTILEELKQRAIVTVTAGPFCTPASGGPAAWWVVTTESGRTGWVAESVNGTYYLDPL